MSTPIIQNVIPSLRETVFAHLKSYLGGEGELSSIQESLEFWYDHLRDKEHPELPMWQDVPSNEQDQLFDAWIDAFSLGVLERAMEREEKQITVSQFLGVKLPKRPEWSVLEDERLTKSDPVTSPLPVSVPSPAFSVVPAPLVPEAVKTAQEGSVCEVEPLGEEVGYCLAFEDDFHDEVILKRFPHNHGEAIEIYAPSEDGIFFTKNQVRSLIAHLTAWLHTGSFDLKGLPSSPPSSEDTELPSQPE